MQWLSPWALVALVPLGGAIILLYLLRLKRQQVTISSVFLWRRVIEDIEANTPFQRLRKNLLLLLQLLALAALVLGLGAPYVLSHRTSGGSTVIVLDASASMKATDVPGSRFEEAKSRAKQVIGNLGRGEEAALVVSAARAWVACPFTTDRRVLQSALAAAEPTDDSTDMRQALLLALSLAQKRTRPRVYLISDGAFPPLTGLPGGAALQFLRVGERCDNVALLAFEVSRTPGKPRDELFLRVRNYSPEAKSGSLSLYLEDQLLDAQPLALRGGEDKAMTFALTVSKPGLLSARLDLPERPRRRQRRLHLRRRGAGRLGAAGDAGQSLSGAGAGRAARPPGLQDRLTQRRGGRRGLPYLRRCPLRPRPRPLAAPGGGRHAHCRKRPRRRRGPSEPTSPLPTSPSGRPSTPSCAASTSPPLRWAPASHSSPRRDPK